MRLSKCLGALLVVLLASILSASPAAAESYWDCSAAGVEKNGPRKVDLTVRLDLTGSKIISGQIKFAKVLNGKTALPGGEYSYAGGEKLTRDAGPYEWVMEADWTGTSYNCDNSTSKIRGTVMIRKLKIQNIAEMELKSKEGTVWFVFPHGCEYKQVTAGEQPAASGDDQA